MGRRLAAAVLVTLVVIGLAQVALVSARFPWSGGDFVSDWGLKARALYRSGDLDSFFRVDPKNVFAHPEYPPLWPFLLALVAKLTNGWEPLHFWFLWPLLCLAAAALTMRAIHAPRLFQLAAASFAVWLPYYRTPLYCGYAEALLLVFILGAASEVERLGDDVDIKRALPLAAFLVLAAATKNEGLVFAGAICAVLLLEKRTRRAAIVSGLAVLLLVELPWTIFVKLNGPEIRLKDFSLKAFDPERLVTAAAYLLREAVLPGAAWLAGAAWLLFVAKETRRRRRRWLLVAALHVAALFGSLAFSVWDPEWHLRWTWDRLALVPIAILIPVLAEAVAECVLTGSPADNLGIDARSSARSHDGSAEASPRPTG